MQTTGAPRTTDRGEDETIPPRTGVTAQVDYYALTSARWGDFERLMGARLTDGLVACVVPLKSGTWGVALWRQAGSDLRSVVAVKHCVVRDGRIPEHDLTEGDSALAELAESGRAGYTGPVVRWTT
ncbi:hypothetical protein U7230_03540 [Carboxydochorda subterranea]|uniref:Uncharacterized protein n=1 Tax=Carboxydichorda subterranea TaxID=3109565 RepID=A0ABZ1C2F0_9FIRM|nr:hypothetical protein [Limnochorda sp. L945t]WRP18995.1 hypothetical protein U7230_03540 [Limnochorda sp. L945t]